MRDLYRSGWAYGDRGVWNLPGPGYGEESRYLTILGSAHRRPVLHPTREAAEIALGKESYRNSPHLRLRVQHVTETPHGGVSGGYAYRITGTE